MLIVFIAIDVMMGMGMGMEMDWLDVLRMLKAEPMLFPFVFPF